MHFPLGSGSTSFSGDRQDLRTALALNIAIYAGIFNKFEVDRGSGVLIRSNCGTVHRADAIIHLALNVMSTLILGASDYCMKA
jgi:hypothetical protein